MNKDRSLTEKYLYTKQSYIKNAIFKLYNLTSNNVAYKHTNIQLQKLIEDLWYTPPELLDKLWMDIYSVLVNTIPLMPDSPICITHIHSIYNVTTEHLINLDNNIG